MSAHLELVDEGRDVALLGGDELLVGREADCDVVLANPAVSRRHLRLSNRGIEWLVEDLGSRHGTVLNGAPLRENQPTALRDRDRLEVAGSQVVFHAERPDLATEERTAFLAQQVVADMLGSLRGSESSPYLRFVNGPMEGRRITLDGQQPYLVMGRSPDCDVHLDEGNVSRRHARVSVDFSGIWVEDLGSKNGILVAGRTVRDKVRLRDRTELQVGGVQMVFYDPASAYLGDLDASGERDPVEDEAGSTDQQAEFEPTPEPLAVAEPSTPVQVLSVGEDSGLAVAAEAESKTLLAMDEAGNWSKSLPQLGLDEPEAATPPEPAPEAEGDGPDKLLIGLFGGAVVLMIVVVALLLS